MHEVLHPAIVLLLFIFAVAQPSSVVAQSSDQIPTDSIRQNSPCSDQPKSLKELTEAFDKGRIPSRHEMTGTWVQIGGFGDSFTLNCFGLKRGPKLEWVMVAKQYSLQLFVIGTDNQTTTLKGDGAGSIWFLMEFGFDHLPVYKCRITQRQTLACLESVYAEGPIKDLPLDGAGCEFKKMFVKPDEIFKRDRSAYR